MKLSTSLKTAAVVVGVLFVINNYRPLKRVFNGEVSVNEALRQDWLSNRG